MRRDAKEVWNTLYYKMRQEWIVPDIETYLELSEAFRGGNTHANRFFVAPEDCDPIITENVKSYDRSSSYPDVMCNCLFPLGQWKIRPGIKKLKDIEHYISRGKAVVFRCSFSRLRLKKWNWGCPYLSKDKGRNIDPDATIDNGRILYAETYDTTLTDVDWKIVSYEYEWDDVEFYDVKICTYKPLPEPFIKLIQSYYKNKTELKGIEEKRYLYNESKAKINSLYGMSAQKTLRDPILFTDNDDELYEEGEADYAKQISDSIRRAFLPYSVGVWVTAWARYWLERAIMLVEETPNAYFIYTDTDSIKFVGEVDFTALNAEIQANSERSGSYATDRKGKIHYMGVYEYEETYPKFATMGAKKYIYGDDEHIHVTISGVVKKDKDGTEVSALELKNLGGFKAFKAGTIFRKAGGIEAVYNDAKHVCKYTVDGHEIDITRNVCLRPSTYTLGLAAEYSRLLKMLIIGVDNPNIL